MIENTNKLPYLRIGTQWYKEVFKPNTDGTKEKSLIKWSKDEIKLDHSNDKNILFKIPKYDGFCNVPNNINYQQVINNHYNQYHQFTHQIEENECPKSLEFIKHIFREHYNLGLDYIKILYEKPTQILPVLCLVSTERKTGKSTFLKWLQRIFKGNLTINTNEDFKSNFNSDWTSKLVIGLDETFIEKRAIMERIKFLSTTSTYKTESKGKDKFEVDFFGKFILCSNDETGFIKIDSDEIRFWVRKVEAFQSENFKLLDQLITEIPAFLHFLSNRPFSTKQSTRMWFSREEIWTKALGNAISKSQTSLEHELREVIKEQLLDFELNEINLTNKDLMNLLRDSGIRSGLTRHKITEIVRNKWKIQASPSPRMYKQYYWVIENGMQRKETANLVGRYYTFLMSEFKSLE